VAVGLVTVTATLAACGGGGSEFANEPSGKFPVSVIRSTFPNRQHISKRTDLVLGLRNPERKAVPELAITVWTGETKADGSFNIRLDNPQLANPSRPVWILENKYPKLLGNGVTLSNVEKAPSAGAETALTDTYSFGPLKPGKSKVIDWRVTPATTGTYTVHYQVAAGLGGQAKAVTPAGGPVKGEFVVTIGSKPPQTCVLPNGQIVRGACQFGGGGGNQ
jgi:hypothetical protein